MTSPASDNRSSPPPGEETIHLDQFLKLQGLVSTGGLAKMLIQGGEVKVNGQVETRRRRQLRIGDVVEALGETIPVESDADESGDTP